MILPDRPSDAAGRPLRPPNPTRPVPEDDGLPLEIAEPVGRPWQSPTPFAPDGAPIAARKDESQQETDPPDELADAGLIAGVYTFPFHGSVFPRWLAMSTSLAILLWMVMQTFSVFRGPVSLNWIAGVFLMVLTGGFVLIWLIAATASCLAILLDTAEGSASVQWPNAMWVDWAQDCLYVASSAISSIVCGASLGWVLELAGRSYPLVAVTVSFLLFPMVLLSRLEAATPLGFLTRPILWSLVHCWSAWMMMYLQSGILVFVSGWFSWRLLIQGWPFAGAAVSFVVVAALMLYCRLLGRLARHCSSTLPLKSNECSE
jgi:hypothetical protein